MHIIAVQFKDKKNPEKFGGREYTYYTKVSLAVGDVIVAPVGKGTGVVRVSRIDVKDSEVDVRIMPLMKTINEVIKPKEEQKCRVCGCTWGNACPGGCYFVEDNLCNKCAEAAKEDSQKEVGNNETKADTVFNANGFSDTKGA